MVIGYTSGVFDLFHIGHLNLLKNAKGMCDKLIVGVTTDDLSLYKGKKPLIPFEERLEIVRAVRYVDAVVPQEDVYKRQMEDCAKATRLAMLRMESGISYNIGNPEEVTIFELYKIAVEARCV